MMNKLRCEYCNALLMRKWKYCAYCGQRIKGVEK